LANKGTKIFKENFFLCRKYAKWFYLNFSLGIFYGTFERNALKELTNRKEYVPACLQISAADQFITF
jgi:hypothetical protein